MTVTEQQRKRIKGIAQELFLEIVKHQPYTELEGDLNHLGKYCANVATTYVMNDWDNAINKILKNI